MSRTHPALRAAHVASVFASAFLLFLAEPMIAKALLPRFGGSPSVWATCLVFFQALLLAGYGWSHLLSRLPPRIALAAQAALLVAAALFVPPVAHGAAAPGTASPIPALLAALALAIGVPFFALSTNTSLVQHLYARHAGEEPWFLYAVSNTGSLLSLLAYPFVLERDLGLAMQGRVFAAGYGVFLAATAVVLAAAWSRAPAAAAAPVVRVPVPLARRGRWVLLSAVPSLLLVAVSVHVSTDVGAAPLLWVLPLAAYLGTFILAFSPRVPFPRRILAILVSLFLTFGLVAVRGHEVIGLVPGVTASLGVMLLGGWICHGELAADRPDGAEATGYYLWIAVGGLVGGLFGSLVAPLVFDSVAEWPISLVLVAGVAAWSANRETLGASLARPAWWIGPAAFGAILAAAYVHGGPIASWVPLAVLLAGTALVRIPGQYAASALAVGAFVLAGGDQGARILASRRSFFGVVRVIEDGGLRRMLHGTTIHGVQRVDPFSPEPLAYYAPNAPMSWTTTHVTKDGANIAVVGLGTGALAARARAGQRLTFFEIDPIVEPAARAFFSFMNGSHAEVKTVLGDARLTLAAVPDGSFDLLVLDAFSSDAVPNHLLTEEAFRLFLDKTAPHGVVLAHVSNRHLDLVPLVRGDAAALGVDGRVRRYQPTAEEAAAGAAASTCVAIARNPEALAPFAGPEWTPLDRESKPGVVWTDDRSSILDVLR